MDGTADRLSRLIAEELGECCTGDVEARLEQLEVLGGAIEPDRAAADVETLSALASGTRYRIVRLLAAAEGELCVCELTPLLDVSDSAVSHALADLTDAGLVERRKAGRWRYYRTTDVARRLLAALDGARDVDVASAAETP